MNVNFELYKVFYFVAKNLSFSQAASELYLSQSAISQSIRLLEEKLESKLFLRSTKQVKLTKEGEILFKHVEQAYNFIKLGERSLQELFFLTQGEIKIAASDTICKFHLLPFFQKFTQLYPQIKLSVTNRTSPICIDLVNKGEVDLGVINIPQGFDNTNLDVVELEIIQDVFVAGKTFDDLNDKQFSLDDLSKKPIMMLEKNSVTRDFFDELISSYQVNIQPEIELSSIDLLIELTKIGIGISFVPKQYITTELAKEELFIINIQETIPQRSLGVISNNSIPTSMAGQKFLEVLLQTKKSP